MKVVMKRLEKLASDFGKKYSKSWDSYGAVADAYLVGYKQAREEANTILEISINLGFIHGDVGTVRNSLDRLGEEQVEQEFTNGDHALSHSTFSKWKEDNYKLPFKEAMKSYLPMFNFDEIRVVEKDGVINFQGTATRNVLDVSTLKVED